MKKIKLNAKRSDAKNKGMFVLVDDEDFSTLTIKHWFTCNGYATAMFNRKQLTMHRYLTGEVKGLVVDHINGNKLDNRRKNLRVCTQSINCRNRTKPTIAKSKHRGVYKHRNKWQVKFMIEGKRIFIGTFEKITEATKRADDFIKMYS
jgi:hypothetical protein